MTVQLKVTEIRKLIKSQLELSDDAIITLNKSVSVELDESGKAGEITLKFKANNAASSAGKKSTKKSDKKSDKKRDATDSEGLGFAKGEKSKLERKFKSDFKKCGSARMALSDFGEVVELASGPHLIIGIDVERSKYIVRKTMDKTRFASTAVVRKNLGEIGESLNEKPSNKSGKKSTKKSTKKSGKKSTKKSDKKSDKSIAEFEIVTKKLRPSETKLSKDEKRKLKSAFEKQATKLVKDGVDADWFYKVLKVKGKSLRMLGLDAKSKTVKIVDIDSGKQSKLKLSKILPF